MAKKIIANYRHLIAREVDKKFQAEVGDKGCLFGEDIWSYTYRNLDVAFTAKIYLRSDGKVAFESLGNTTGWHGSWQRDPEHCVMSMDFSHRVDEDEENLKRTVVCKSEESSALWFGKDESERSIIMTKSLKYRECVNHECWHIVKPLG